MERIYGICSPRDRHDMWLKRVVTSRKFITAVFLLLISSLLLSNFLPRHGSMANELPLWYAQFPNLAKLVTLLGLNALHTSVWFSIVGLLFLVSLSFSTFDQGERSYRLMKQFPAEIGGEEEALRVELLEFTGYLKREGYFCLADNGIISRHVRAPWGYWGNFVLHLGLTCVVLFAFVRVLTEHRTLFRIVEGVVVSREDGTTGEVAGLLARKMTYPATVRLERLTPLFWDNDQLKSVTAEVALYDDLGGLEKVGLNAFDGTKVHGQMFYLSPHFGNAFFLQFYSGDTPPFTSVLTIGRPPRRDKAGYGDLDLPGGRLHLKAKYYADADRQSMYTGNPLLVLRIFDGPNLLNEIRLRRGESGKLGPYLVRLAEVRGMGELLSVGGVGVAGIYGGFAIIFLGSVLVYCATPREVVLRRSASGIMVSWRSVRFRDLYRTERERVMEFCRGEKKS
ncbi:MAG: hypothetical protein FD174_696 [Geobacteraceae bacterium]|nr:MAG: hypothetical protein FD174_696 [Geobacteraceae bacterium]